MKKNKYYVVVPVYNEEANIVRCLNSIKKCHSDIIVVDDGSSDGTGEKLSQYKDIHVLTLKHNVGKGMAMKEGIKIAWKLGGKGVIFLDGDNQHNPGHIEEFVKLLNRGKDIVIGVRLLRTDIPIHRKLGNNVMSFLMRKIFSVSIPDMLCGFRAFSRKGYKQIEWDSHGYGVETEVLTIIGRKGLKYSTVTVDTIYHDKYKGFSIVDGIKIILKLPYWRVKSI